jgi:glutathione synthase/RimK-type ligase-like ATP-grasp enzyme
MKLKIRPYKMASRSAKRLAEALTQVMGYKVLRTHGPAQVNWVDPNGINANKLCTLQAFESHGVPCPKFTTDKGVASEWLGSGGVMARLLLRSSGGKGAVFLPKGSEVIDAPLYVKYIPKEKEYRVHVWKNKVILVQEKRKRKGTNPDSKIRTHGDWVFCTKDIVEPAELQEVGLRAVAACSDNGSGAVDIIWNKKQNKCYALEVNSAPGMCKTTAAIYANAIKEAL